MILPFITSFFTGLLAGAFLLPMLGTGRMLLACTAFASHPLFFRIETTSEPTSSESGERSSPLLSVRSAIALLPAILLTAFCWGVVSRTARLLVPLPAAPFALLLAPAGLLSLAVLAAVLSAKLSPRRPSARTPALLALITLFSIPALEKHLPAGPLTLAHWTATALLLALLVFLLSSVLEFSQSLLKDSFLHLWYPFLPLVSLGLEASLVPTLGTEGLTRLLSLCLIVSAIASTVLELTRPAKRSLARLAFVGLLVLLLPAPLVAPTWKDLEPLGTTVLAGQPATFAAEDLQGLLELFGTSAQPSIRLNGQTLFDTRALSSEATLCHLTLLLHPSPRSVLVVGAGTGQALEAALTHPVLEVLLLGDSALRSSVISHLSDNSASPLKDARLRIRYDSFRELARTHKASLDSIVVLAAPLLEQSSRQTLEGLRSLKALLRPGGTLGLELRVGGHPEQLLSALSTFEAVFPDSLVWRISGQDDRLVLTSGPRRPALSVKRLEAAFTQERLIPSLSRLGWHSGKDVMSLLLLTFDGLEAIDAPPLSDLGPLPLFTSSQPSGRSLASLRPFIRPLAPAVAVDDPPRAGDWQASMEATTRSGEVWLELLSQLEKGDLSHALKEAQALLNDPRTGQRDLEGLVRPTLERAKALKEKGDVDQAIAELTMARIIHPRLPDIPLQLAQLEEMKGHREKARTLYEATLELEPQRGEAVLGLADLYRQDGRLKEAITLLTSQLERSPENALIVHNLGALYLATGELNKAGEAFERAIRLKSDLGAAHTGMAEVLFRRGVLPDAFAEAELATRLDPSADALNVLGQIALKLNRIEVASSAFVRCLLRAPEHLECMGAMGILAAEAGDMEKARDYWEKVLAIHPENQPAQKNLKLLYQEYPFLKQETSP